MRIGELRKQITIQAETPTADGAGGYALTWMNIATMWGEIKPLSGSELFTAQHLEGHVTHQVTLRYRSDITITNDMRMIYNNRVFNIRSVLNSDERNQWFEMLVEEGGRCMTDALFAVQQAICNALAGSSEVQAALGNPPHVYDHVPPDAVFPYIVFGAIAAKPYDDKDRTGIEQTVTLDIWSRYRGSKEAKDILQTVYDALHRAALAVSGETFLSCEFAGAELTQESDGLTYSAKAQFNVITQSS